MAAVRRLKNPVRVARLLVDEPDRGGNLFQLAPRLMITYADAGRSGLLGAGSRVRNRLLLAGEPSDVAEMRAWLVERLPPAARSTIARLLAVAGALLGASVGNDYARAQHRPAPSRSYVTTERRCEIDRVVREEERIDGYRVTYRYKGRLHTVRMHRHPGKYVRVNRHGELIRGRH